MKLAETINTYRKKHALFLFFVTWIICLFIIAAFEPFSTGYFGRKILPSWDDYIPFPVKKAVSRWTAPSVEINKQKTDAKKNNLYAGNNFKHLKNFFKKLSTFLTKKYFQKHFFAR